MPKAKVELPLLKAHSKPSKGRPGSIADKFAAETQEVCTLYAAHSIKHEVEYFARDRKCWQVSYACVHGLSCHMSWGLAGLMVLSRGFPGFETTPTRTISAVSFERSKITPEHVQPDTRWSSQPPWIAKMWMPSATCRLSLLAWTLHVTSCM